MSSCTYRFIPSSLIDLPKQRSYELRVRQQPQRAKMSVINERDRRPIEPPPILQVHLHHCSADDRKKSLQCPFYFMVANLMCADSDKLLSTQDYLAGSTVSSLYRLRDIDDSDGGFFVFGDLYCKKQGHYRLQFNLFEIVEGDVQNRQVIISEPFQTYMPKHYPGPVEATFLSRAFSDQGVRIRIRKEHRLNSSSARKRKLDVQALMDSQPTPKPFKSVSTPVSMNHHHHHLLPIRPMNVTKSSIKTEPVRIAPASHQQQQQSMIYNHSPPRKYYSMPTPSPTITCLPSHDHPSPSSSSISSSSQLVQSSSLSSSMDDTPMMLLDEYHLQQQQYSSSSSCASSTHSLHPTTPPYDHDSPSLQPHVWGESLPPLKAVMSGFTSRSIPLVLPCPFDNTM